MVKIAGAKRARIDRARADRPALASRHFCPGRAGNDRRVVKIAGAKRARIAAERARIDRKRARIERERA